MAYGTSNPTPGGSNDTWGATLNTILDASETYAVRGEATYDIANPVNGTRYIRLNARIPFDIDQLTYKTDAGTCTVQIEINGTGVTGLTSLSVTTTETTSTATAAKSVSIGDDVTLVISSVVGVGALIINLWGDRTGAGTA